MVIVFPKNESNGKRKWRHFDGIFVYVSTKGFHFDIFPRSGAASEDNFFKLWIIPFH